MKAKNGFDFAKPEPNATSAKPSSHLSAQGAALVQRGMRLHTGAARTL
jgi:hypothetical protein